MDYRLCLRYSFDLPDDAALIEDAARDVLSKGIRTADIMQAGCTKVSTTGMGDAVLAALERLGA